MSSSGLAGEYSSHKPKAGLERGKGRYGLAATNWLFSVAFQELLTINYVCDVS